MSAAAQRATTEAPQRSLRHLISKTRSRAQLRAETPPNLLADTKPVQWTHPKDRIPFWNITPGDKVLVWVV